MTEPRFPRIGGLTPEQQAELDKYAAEHPPEPLETLPVYCAFCGQPVTLTVSNWPRVWNHAEREAAPDDHPLMQQAVWNCPHCEKENEGGIPGRLQFAKKGH